MTGIVEPHASRPLMPFALAASTGVLVGVFALCVLIWFGGPLLAIGSVQPFASAAGRLVAIGIVLLVVAGAVLIRAWSARRAANALTRGLVDSGPEDDSAVLAERMKDALTTLKQIKGQRGTYLYDLPWYLLIGPPATGKTTALINSGLKFPLAGGPATATVSGIGGTRYCDWLFAEDAVFIDTAGRYATQDSDPKVDRRSWLAFLDLLKRHRTKQPINGVIIAFSLPDLLTLDAAAITAHATNIRTRLLELHDRLKINFPVYALFTKADLVAGFTDYFADLNEEARRQVWGATFQTADRKRNMVGDVPAEFDLLVERLNAGMADRLQEEPVPGTRVALFGFPGQMAGLKQPVATFLEKVFEATRYQSNITLRGFYFTSGTQHGTAVDRLLLALVKNFGAENVPPVTLSTVGKSYFLRDLLARVVIPESAWVSTDRAAIRRALAMKTAALTLIALVVASCLALWSTSYDRNDRLVTATTDDTATYARSYGPLAAASEISDANFERILPALDRLRAMPPFQPQQPWSGAGLDQGVTLREAADQTYGTALERLLRPRLLYRLEDVLRVESGDPIALYEALKVYMMLGGQHHPVDRRLVLGWVAKDLDRLIPGPGTQAEMRQRLVDHVSTMLDNEPVQKRLVEPSGPIQAEAQKQIARLSAAERAYALLRSQAVGQQPDWLASQHGGQDFDRVFETRPGAEARVPGFFTYAGFDRSLMAKLPGIADQLTSDDAWVLGDLGKQAAVATSYDTLKADVLAIYRKDFVAAWQNALARLRLRNVVSDRPRYAVLAALSSRSTTPLLPLVTSITAETTFTKPQAGADQRTSSDAAPQSSDAGPSSAVVRAPGAEMEAAFLPYHALLTPSSTGGRPIDDLVAILGNVLDGLSAARAQPGSQTAELTARLSRLQAISLTLPPVLRDMMLTVKSDVETDISTVVRQHLAQAFADQVAAPCRAKIRSAYPFSTGGKDLSIDDFARMFAPAPTGAFDSFFDQNLKTLVDTKRQPWAMRPDVAGGAGLSGVALQSLQAASAIRDAFFPPGQAAPSISFRVIPPPITTPGYIARLEINGTVIETRPNSPLSGGSVSWPGPTQDGGVAAINLLSDGGGEPPVGIEPKYGGWALFRLLDGARPIPNGLARKFLLGGMELEYRFLNPKAADLFRLIRSFSCPAGP